MSKNVITILMMSLFATTMFAQAPQKMSYQAVVRNASNALVANANVGMRISVLQGTATGTPVYVETQTTMTNDNGLVTLEIGGGAVVTGTFASISWGTGTYFIKTETDPTGGTNYTIVGTSQMLSVPYAMYAASSGAVTNNTIISASDVGSSQSIRNVGVDVSNISIVVPESGKYLITFSGNAENFGSYDSNSAGYDTQCDVMLKIVGQASNLFQMTATKRLDEYLPSVIRSYINMQPTRSLIATLIAGQILKVEYFLETAGTPPTGAWNIGKTEVTLLKIGN